jgi:hypothetical protein
MNTITHGILLIQDYLLNYPTTVVALCNSVLTLGPSLRFNCRGLGTAYVS